MFCVWTLYFKIREYIIYLIIYSLFNDSHYDEIRGVEWQDI